MTERIPDAIQFPCPACDGTATVSLVHAGTVTHTFPVCARYAALETLDDASDYIRDARIGLRPQ